MKTNSLLITFIFALAMLIVPGTFDPGIEFDHRP